MANNSNFKASSSQQFTHFVNFLAVNLTSLEVGLYRASMASRNPLTFSMSNYAGFLTEKSTVKDQNGGNVSYVKGDVADPSGEMTIEYRDDAIGLQSNAYGMPKAFFDAIFKGAVLTYGSDQIRVVSTLGAILTDVDTACTVDEEFGGLFKYEWSNLFDGQKIDMNGNRVLVSNAFVDSFKDEATAVMLECIQNVGGATRSIMMPSIMTSDIEYSQNAGSENSLSLTSMYCTECWERETYFMDGVYKAGANTDTDKQEFEVDYIMISASDPTDFGTSGDLACIVDPTTGAFAIKESDGSTAWTAVTTGTMAVNGRIYATSVGTTTVAGVTAQNGFVAVKTSGADNSGVAYNFAYDTTGATLNYVCKCYEFNRDDEVFEAYQSSSIC